MDASMTVYLVAGLAFVSVLGVGLAFTAGGGSSAAQQKRLKQVSLSRDARNTANDKNSQKRSKELAESMKELRDKETQRKKDLQRRTISDSIKQAGFEFSLTTFWFASVITGAAVGFIGFVLGASLYVVGGLVFVGIFGLPRWYLGMAVGARQKKFSTQFADGIDVIVRGVKSGLPLIECLRIIARESPQPLGGEFTRVIDAIQMGSTVSDALDRLHKRMPLPEVNFFNIVISIQQQAGGNLSEALGNLSTVLRSRKMLKEKIKALSSEAKASAYIIGSLPICVMGLVYLSTPSYIMELFNHSVGHMILLLGATLMGLGIFVMRQMINFET